MKRTLSSGEPQPEASERELLDLAYRALTLKDTPRSGWLLREVRDPESVADHSWSTALLCLLFASLAGVDRDRAVSIAVLHDLAEVETGDIAARVDERDRTVSVTEKSRLEHLAIANLLPDAAGALGELWHEYEQRASDVAVFVRDMNLIDMCLQVLCYAEQRRAPTGQDAAGRHLEEFFESARRNISTPLGKRLLSQVEARHRSLHGAEPGPLS